MRSGRPRDPQTPYKVRLQRAGKYAYAATYDYVTDEASGTTKRRSRHWGRVTADGVFEPNAAYLRLPEAEREKLIFPPEWDLSKARIPADGSASDRSDVVRVLRSLQYGHTWLLGQLAEKAGIVQDLRTIFCDNDKKAQDILTLAFFLCAAEAPLTSLPAIQQIEWFPSETPLDVRNITQLLTSITNTDHEWFEDLRKKRLADASFCAAETKIRSPEFSPFNVSAQARHAQHKHETELIVYGMDSFVPVHYETFADRELRFWPLRTMRKALLDTGYHDAVLLTDRGIASQDYMDERDAKCQKMITTMDVRSPEVLQRIRAVTYCSGVPEGMEWIPAAHVYARQYELEARSDADPQRLNLYLTRCDDLDECAVLTGADFARGQSDGTCNADGYDEPETPGFFAVKTAGVELSTEQTLALYTMWALQERFLNNIAYRTEDFPADVDNRTWKKCADGLRFVAFVALILRTQLERVWASSDTLRLKFVDAECLLLAMRTIWLRECDGRESIVDAFDAKHRLICREFGVKAPKRGSQHRLVTENRLWHVGR